MSWTPFACPPFLKFPMNSIRQNFKKWLTMNSYGVLISAPRTWRSDNLHIEALKGKRHRRIGWGPHGVKSVCHADHGRRSRSWTPLFLASWQLPERHPGWNEHFECAFKVQMHKVHMLAYCSVHTGLFSMALTRAWLFSKYALFLQGSCTAGWTKVAQIAGGRGSVSVEQAREPLPHRILQRACQVLRQNSSLHKLQAWCVFACRSYNPASCACCKFEPLLVRADATAVVTRGQRCTVMLSSFSQQVLCVIRLANFLRQTLPANVPCC